MANYYKENKDARGLEVARIKRMKEAEEKKKKDRLGLEIQTKKRLLSSTSTILDAKKSVLRQKEMALNRITTDILSIERKVHELEAIINNDKNTSFVAKDQEVLSKIDNLKNQEKTAKKEVQQTLTSIGGLESEIQRMTRALDIKKTELLALQSKKRRADLEANNIERSLSSLEIKTKNIKGASSRAGKTAGSQTGLDNAKKDLQEKKKRIASLEREVADFKREIDQLSRDKDRMSMDIGSLERGLR